MKFVAEIQEQDVHFELAADNGQLRAIQADSGISLDLHMLYPGVYSLILNHHSHVITVRFNSELVVQVDGVSTPVVLKDEMALQLEAMGWESALDRRMGQVLAPIPGLVTQVLKSVGDVVTEGDALLIMEAMKMENELKAPVSGTVQSIHVQSGQSVEKGALILEIA
ncbi:MAG: acetyl-CoA carboxylase biotin carboxyl carrier protein subunit [Lentisphaeria bacterium]|nr:acetyl-CoA carboxylase biotin carboxyl carrier protein subunit [Candidatus Neomarinimicrobiota bacterium]MCF7841424.1 acetyl-CoA carboxylase biotin carboxyl carrier protein subunit [Lentisphaeria bacterium]